MIFINRIQLLLWTALLIAVYILAWKLQSSLFLNYDVSWLLHAAERMLAGGSYAQDFFETNPPLILYLYLPPLVLSKFFGAKLIPLFRAYVFLLASFSLTFCWFLTRQIFDREAGFLANLFFLTMALVFLLLPCFEFGQRDHLLVIFSLPYLLMVVCRLQGLAFKTYSALGLGLLAALGFALKPYFLLAPLLVEIYYTLHKKKPLAWLRPETVAILAFLSIYIASIFIFHPDYLYIVVPYSLRLYYQAVSQPWLALAFNSVAVYCYFPLVFYLVRYRETPYKFLSQILLLGLLGFLLSYFAQRMPHFYHLVPALSLALLLQVLLFYSFLLGLSRRWTEHIFAAFLGMLLFAFPAWLFASNYKNGLESQKELLNCLATFMNNYARQSSVYFFVTAGSYGFPTIDYTVAATVAPRFYFLWMAAGLANQTQDLARNPKPLSLDQHQRDKNFLINMIADDLHRYRPRFIFVDLSEKKYRIRDHQFDYLAYFSTNTKFSQEWKHYRYLTLLEQKGLYKLGVYERRGFP